jgi:putative endonuclease
MQTRLDWHNAGQNAQTVRDRPWHVLVSLEFRTAEAAGQFERYLKTGSGRAFAKRHFP